MPMTRIMIPILFSQFVPSFCSSSELRSRADKAAGLCGCENGGGTTVGAGAGVTGGAAVVGVFGGGTGCTRAKFATVFGISGHGGIFVGTGRSGEDTAE